MMTFRLFEKKLASLPMTVSWYLADLGEARGKQELFTRQSPQRLKVLREHALIESAVSSNRIEGIEIDQSRIGTVIFGKPTLRDRNEEEVRGYREALKRVHEQGAKLPLTEETVKKLHRLCRGEIWDAGQYKERESDIIERYPDGRQRVRFRTVPAAETPACLRELATLWRHCNRELWVHPLIALAAFNLDFLCIHPFRDGNGRVSRLLLLLQCYHLGYEAGRYISLERLIEQNKARYYETLEESSQGWHEGNHNPWPYINYLLSILKAAYQEFEQRLGHVKSPRGAKTDLVESAIRNIAGKFTLNDLERTCPGVSRDMVRRVLRDLQKSGKVECLGRGPGAAWRKRKGNTPEKG
ncbi:MAG: Fic family protein [Deltaproteobacteria bacterium]|nr:Fic family protein [Deltaproteobacteria bacterium]